MAGNHPHLHQARYVISEDEVTKEGPSQKLLNYSHGMFRDYKPITYNICSL